MTGWLEHQLSLHLLPNGGVCHGESDEWSFRAVKRETHVYDVHATILHLLGIDHTALTFHHNSFDRRVTDVRGELIKAILKAAPKE